MKMIINTRRTTNGRPYRKDLSVSCAATSPARRGFYGRAMLAPTRIPRREGNRRGFTIVELVVAIVIIVIVSGAGISLVMTQTKVDSQATQTVDATNICENAIECFRYAVNVSENDTEDEVVGTFKEAFNRTLADDEKLDQPDDNGKYTINNGGAVIEITITENTDENGINTHTITINAVDSFGIVIFNDSYTK